MHNYMNQFGFGLACGLAGVALYILSVQNSILEPLCKIEQVNYSDSVLEVPTANPTPHRNNNK